MKWIDNNDFLIGLFIQRSIYTGPCSAVSCESNCRFRDRDFIQTQSHTFAGIELISMVILLLPLIQEGLLSVTCEIMCTKYW